MTGKVKRFVPAGESEERVLGAMDTAGRELWPHEIATMTGMSQGAARVQIWKMMRRGQLRKGEAGYVPATERAGTSPFPSAGWRIGRGPTDNTFGITTVVDAKGHEVARFNRREDAERVCGVCSGE